jgi:hypothetical protein
MNKRQRESGLRRECAHARTRAHSHKHARKPHVHANRTCTLAHAHAHAQAQAHAQAHTGDERPSGSLIHINFGHIPGEEPAKAVAEGLNGVTSRRRNR